MSPKLTRPKSATAAIKRLSGERAIALALILIHSVVCFPTSSVFSKVDAYAALNV
jgi:hypothetical protein